MSIIDKVKKFNKENLSEKNYKRSLLVAENAKSLCLIHKNQNSDSAYLAGLLNPLVKEWSDKKLRQYAIDNTIIFDDYMISAPRLAHGILAATYAENEFNIKSSKILNALKYHLIARPGMSELEKIVFLANYITEDENIYKNELEVEKKAKIDLDKAMGLALETKIKYLKAKSRRVHITTVRAHSFYTRSKV